MILIADLQYFSPYILYNTSIKSKHIVFDQYEEYRKMSFRNRCTLLGGNGPVHLSIPLEGGRGQRTLMKDILIWQRDNWRDRHWKTITSCYNKSPWFEHYRDSLEALYGRQDKWLMDWNLACFQWVCDNLSLQINYHLTEKPKEKFEGLEYSDWRGKLMPATINTLYPDTQRYPQVFEDRFGFVPNLSILDRLFCLGPSALSSNK